MGVSDTIWITGIVLLASSGACSLFSACVYAYYSHTAFAVTSTIPFVEFNKVRDVYKTISSVDQVLGKSTELLKTAWCNEPTSHFPAYPQKRSEACTCINTIYAQFVIEITSLISTKFRPYELEILQQSILSPWISTYNNTNISKTCTLKYMTSRLQLAPIPIPPSTIDSYGDRTVRQCLSKRTVWKVENIFKIQPLVMSFYCSVTLFTLSCLFMLLVMSPQDVSRGWGRYAIFGLLYIVVFFLLLMDPWNNSFYIVAIVLVTTSIMYSLKDELQSIYEENIPVKPQSSFMPPNPLLICIWYYVQLCMPLYVTYLGVSNTLRDAGALVGLFVLGYIVALSMQRIYWTKWYVAQGMKVDGITLSLGLETKFKPILLFTLSGAVVIGTLGIVLVMYMHWYTQEMSSGNWIASVIFMIFCGIFITEIFIPNERFSESGQLFQINNLQTTQVYMIVLVNFLFTVATACDAFAK